MINLIQGDALKAPFPYFGGKATVADVVWDALGQLAHYIEPFFGSGAVLLARPNWTPDRDIKSVVDKDGPKSPKSPLTIKKGFDIMSLCCALKIHVLKDCVINGRVLFGGHSIGHWWRIFLGQWRKIMGTKGLRWKIKAPRPPITESPIVPPVCLPSRRRLIHGYGSQK